MKSKNQKLLISTICAAATLFCFAFLVKGQENTSDFEPNQDNPEINQSVNTKKEINRQDVSVEEASIFDEKRNIEVGIGTAKSDYQPGEHLFLEGEIENRSGQIIDGKIFAQIKRVANIEDGSRGEVVDEFFIEENLYVSQNSKQPVEYYWEIPMEIQSGLYRVDYFISDSAESNFKNLPFGTGLMNGFSEFSIIDGQRSNFYFDAGAIELNGESYVSGEPAGIKENSVSVSQKIINPEEEGQELVVSYELFTPAGAVAAEEKKETVNLGAGSSAELGFDFSKTKAPFYLLKIIADNGERKAVSNIYLNISSDSKTGAYPLIDKIENSKFPLVKGEEAEIAVYVRDEMSKEDFASGVDVVLEDESGNLIDELSWQGELGGNPGKISKNIKAGEDLDFVKIIARTKNSQGELVDQKETIYDCQSINNSGCKKMAAGASNNDSSWHEGIVDQTKALILLVLGFIFMILSGIWISLRAKSHREVYKKMRVFVFLLGAGALLTIFGLGRAAEEDGDAGGKTAMISQEKSFVSGKVINFEGICESDLKNIQNKKIYLSLPYSVGITSGGNKLLAGEEIDFEGRFLDPVFEISSDRLNVFEGGWCDNEEGAPCDDLKWEQIATDKIVEGEEEIEINSSVSLGMVKPGIEIISDNPDIISCDGLKCKAVGEGKAKLKTKVGAAAGNVWFQLENISANSQTGCAIIDNAKNSNPVFRKSAELEEREFFWDIEVVNQEEKMKININKQGSGKGVIIADPGFMEIDSEKSSVNGEYFDDSRLNLTAIPESGSIFSGWTGSCETNEAMPRLCKLDIDNNKNVMANFETNEAPIINSINGPSSGIAGTEYEFKVKASDPNGSDLEIGIDWNGDGSVVGDDWKKTQKNKEGEYFEIFKKSWDSSGDIDFQAIARDEGGLLSDREDFSISLCKAGEEIEEACLGKDQLTCDESNCGKTIQSSGKCVQVDLCTEEKKVLDAQECRNNCQPAEKKCPPCGE